MDISLLRPGQPQQTRGVGFLKYFPANIFKTPEYFRNHLLNGQQHAFANE